MRSSSRLPASQYGRPSSKKNGEFPNNLEQYAQVKHSGWKCFPIAFKQSYNNTQSILLRSSSEFSINTAELHLLLNILAIKYYQCHLFKQIRFQKTLKFRKESCIYPLDFRVAFSTIGSQILFETKLAIQLSTLLNESHIL